MLRHTLLSLSRQRHRPAPHSLRSLSGFFNHNSRPSDLLTADHKEPIMLEIPSRSIPSPKVFYEKFTARAAKKEDLIITDTDLSTRFDKRPTIGSVVEYIKDGTTGFGAVIVPQRNLFSRKELTVFNTSAESIEVDPCEITFHLHGIIPKDTIHDKGSLGPFLNAFIQHSRLLVQQNKHLIRMVQAWYEQENTSVDLDMHNIVNMIAAHSPEYKTLPLECLVYGIHMHLRTRPLEWRVMSEALQMRSLVSESVPTVRYTLNSVALTESLASVVNMDSGKKESVAMLLKNHREGENALAVEYRDSERKESDTRFKEINTILDFLKYYVQYPHESLRPTVTSLLGSSYETNQVGISKLTADLNYTSQLMLSSESFRPQPQDLKLTDNFRHIRFTNSLPVYALPSETLYRLGLPTHSELAISLDKTSSPTHYTLNIHIPDTGSYITQTAKHLPEILSRSTSIDFTTHIIPLLSQYNLEQLSFTPGRDASCLTISINYPHTLDAPWTKTTSQVRLERLVNIQHVPQSDLEELWKSKFPLLTDLFNFFMPSDAYAVLDARGRNELMSVFNMVDYWFLKRSRECSMERQFERMEVRDQGTRVFGAEAGRGADFVEYLTREIKMIASEHVSKFVKRHGIEVLTRRQDVLSRLGDSLSVMSSDMVIPSYEGTSYEELTFFKDREGMTPIASFVGASYFLGPEIVSTEPGRFASLGLPLGLVQVCEGLHDFESVLNQWQLIMHLQEQFVHSQSDYKMGVKTLFPKSYKKMTAAKLMDFYELKVKPLQRGNRRLERQSYESSVIGVLRAQVEEDPKINWSIFKCVIMKSCEYPKLAHAYCFDLDMMVLVNLSPWLDHVKVGDQIICSQIAQITLDQVVLQA